MLAIILLTAACTDSESSGVEPQPSPDSTTAPPTTITAESTTTTAATTVDASASTAVPPATSPATPATTDPPPVDACETTPTVVDADIDGDGVRERVGVDERAGGQLLIACGEGRVWTLELDYGVWYLGSADIEPDGTDELLLGGAEIGDLPDHPQMLMFSVRPEGRHLIVDAADGGILVGGTFGASCIDVDDDGLRELVRVDVDPDGSDGADLVRCADPIEMTRVGPPTSICDAEGTRYRTDLDRDGRDDLVVQRQSNAPEVLAGYEFGVPAVAICLASGATDDARFGGMGEIFAVSDGTGDRATIWTGGTSVSAAFLAPSVVVDGRIVPISTAEGPLSFEDGFTFPDRVASFGCLDADGDDAPDLTQVVGTRTGDVVEWTRRSYASVGADAQMVAESSGTVEVSPRESDELVVTPEELTSFEALAGDADCGFLEPID